MTFCVYRCTQYCLHTQYMLLTMLMTCCAYNTITMMVLFTLPNVFIWLNAVSTSQHSTTLPTFCMSQHDKLWFYRQFWHHQMSQCSDRIILITFKQQVLTLSNPTSDLVQQYDFPVLLQCRKTSYTIFVASVHPLSEPVRRFSSCSMDFSQQIAQVVLFLFLYVFLF
jgi:hypothetical protein